jgi:adenylate cyclase, class 2
MKATPPTETEIKLPAPGAAEARRRLRVAGFRIHRRRVFEDNMLFDTSGLKLRRAGSLLRVRRAGDQASLTYKGRGVSGGRYKTREELEVKLSAAGAMTEIIQRLGFRPVFRYQKYRTEYKQHGTSGVATLDETPIGIYLELEGTPAWIDRSTRRLGFRAEDYITESYGRLYLDWCKRQKVKPGDMMFSPVGTGHGRPEKA